MQYDWLSQQQLGFLLHLLVIVNVYCIMGELHMFYDDDDNKGITINHIYYDKLQDVQYIK